MLDIYLKSKLVKFLSILDLLHHCQGWNSQAEYREIQSFCIYYGIMPNEFFEIRDKYFEGEL